MSCLYILEIRPLSVAFTPDLQSYFPFLNGLLCCAKAFGLIKSHLFICVLIVIILGGGSNKMLLDFMSKSILTVYFSRCFIVSGLIFRSLILFEFIFVDGVSVLLSLTCNFPVFSAPFIEVATFFH